MTAVIQRMRTTSPVRSYGVVACVASRCSSREVVMNCFRTRIVVRMELEGQCRVACSWKVRLSHATVVVAEEGSDGGCA